MNRRGEGEPIGFVPNSGTSSREDLSSPLSRVIWAENDYPGLGDKGFVLLSGTWSG